MASATLNDDQRLYLQTIFDYFQKEGKWPTHIYLERFFIGINPDLDIEQLVTTLPPGLTDPVNLYDASSKAYLTIPAVYLCKDSAQILDYFIRVIQRCVEIFFTPDVTELRITSEEIGTLYGWGEMDIRKVGLLLQAEPTIWASTGYNEADGTWSVGIARGIRRFRGVQTIEQYLEIRGSINQTSGNPSSTSIEESQVDNPSVNASHVVPQVDNLQENVSNAAPQVDKTLYVPRAFGGTIILQTKQEELQVDNPSANASNAAPQVDNHGEQTEQIEIAIRALADTPSDIDLLQFSDFADALVDFIKSDKTQKPLTIAIDAAWGMGKTTLMRMIRRKLEGKADKEKHESSPSRIERKQKDQNATAKPTFPIVWFNAWQYDQEDSLWAALVLEILEQVGKQFTPIQRAGFWWNLTQKRLGKGNLFIQIVFRVLPFIVGLIVLLAILFGVATLWQGNTFIETVKKIFLPIAGILGGVTLIYASVKDVYTRLIKPLDQRIAQYIREPNYKDRVGFLTQFKEDFSSIVEAATSEGKWPLIIFIDDLDRCAPPKPVEIIEAINLLLDAQYCVFVMGMDTRNVAGSIEAKYKDLLTYPGATDSPGELTLGQLFLEKIIQVTFHLPRADTMVVQSFIDTMLSGTEENKDTPPPREDILVAEQLIEAEQRVGKSLDAAAETVRQARSDISDSTLVKAKQEIRVKSFDDSQVVQAVIRQVAPFLALNPRKIKRFINMFRLQALIANRRGLLETGAIKLDVLAKWIVISSRWPSMVDALLADEHFIDHLKKAREIRDTIRRERLNSEPENEQKLQPYDEKSYQAKLETYTINPHVKLLVDATDLMNLLNQLTDVDVQALPIYLHLTRITSQTE